MCFGFAFLTKQSERCVHTDYGCLTSSLELTYLSITRRRRNSRRSFPRGSAGNPLEVCARLTLLSTVETDLLYDHATHWIAIICA